MCTEGRNLSFEFKRIDLSPSDPLFSKFAHPNGDFENFSFIILKESTPLDIRAALNPAPPTALPGPTPH